MTIYIEKKLLEFVQNICIYLESVLASAG